MAVYIVHASLLLIFAGGIIDGLFGFNGFMALQKGQTSNVIELRKGGTRTTSLQREMLRRRTRKLCRRLAETLVVEAGGSRRRPGNRSQRDRGERSPGSSGTALLPGQLWATTGKLDGLKVAGHARRNGPSREITLTMNQPLASGSPTPRVILAEYIPDFFVRDNQVFKRSDDQ